MLVNSSRCIHNRYNVDIVMADMYRTKLHTTSSIACIPKTESILGLSSKSRRNIDIDQLTLVVSACAVIATLATSLPHFGNFGIPSAPLWHGEKS